MKLIRFGDPGNEKPGVLIDEIRKDCSMHFGDWDHDFFQNNGLETLQQLLKGSSASLTDVPKDARWGACIARPYMTMCIALNYTDHAKEVKAEIPTEPTIFCKSTRSMIGAYDDIIIPKNSKKTDWEIELGVILKKDASYLNSVEEAKDYIAGYAISNDVSEREFQMEHGGQRVKGKSCDTFNPLGPYLLTTDEMIDPHNLNMILTVNGEVRQNSNTKNMIFNSYHLVHYISQFMTLEAGTLISTGTPPGVGLGMKPPTFLKEGDVIELQMDKLGIQRNILKPYV